MEAARTIRNAVARVAMLRHAFEDHPALGEAVSQVKRIQSRRFAGTYSDLLSGGPFAPAARFFLDELYSDKDFAERDAQFARIAGALERLFPQQVVATAVALAELHALTEELDQAMALSWLTLDDARDDARRYVSAWREVGRRADRETQLVDVLAIGHEMAKLTRAPGLRTLLRMMRGPAAAADLGSLQRFLETGFDTFAGMARRRGQAEEFLSTIQRRETALIATLFDSLPVASGTEMARILGQAP